MATSGTPFEGRDNIIGPNTYETGTLYLGLYTNTPNSLTASSVIADLTEPSGTGYAKITLSGTWSYANGVVTYDHGTPDDPTFENTGASNWTGDITGAFITDNTYILHFKDLTVGATTMTPGLDLKIDVSSLAG